MANTSQSELGSVVSLWRYPVKSMMGEEFNRADVTERGLLGDRAYALIDRSDGKVASAKNPRKWPHLFDFRAAFFQLHDEHADRFKKINRLETADDDGNLKFTHQLLVFAKANDRAHMARRNETLHAIPRRTQQGANRRRHQHVRREDAEILQAKPFSLQNRHSVGGSGGFESHSKENDFAIRLRARQLNRVRWRVHDAHITTLSLDVKQVRL